MDAPARLDEADSGLRQAVRNGGLARLLVAFWTVSFSELAFVTALSIYAFRVGGALAVGFVGFRLLPGAISSALIAPLVDSRPEVLTRIAQLRVFVLGTSALAALEGLPLALILVLVCVDAVVAAPYRPAQSRVVPLLARAPGEISATAAGLSIVKTLGQSVGALAGGIASAVATPGSAMAGTAVVMAGAAAITVGLGEREPGPGPARAAFKAGVAALPAVLAHRDASPFVIASGLRTLIRGVWSALLVVVALRLLGLGSSGVGVLNAAAGVGTVLALPVTTSLIGRPRLAPACAIAFVGAGITLSAVGALPAGALTVIVVGVWGLAMAAADATSLSLLARLLDRGTLSRTVGVMESLKLAFEGVGALLAPALVALFGLRPSLLLAGLPLPLLVLSNYRRMDRADLAAAGRGAAVLLLHRVPLLRSLDMASLEDVAACAQRAEVIQGTEVVRQGEAGEDFYVIESGEAEVLLDGFGIGHLSPGSGFGERALLRSTPRTATVRALTDMTLYAIDRTSFLSAVTGHRPEIVEGAELPAQRSAPEPTERPLPHVLRDVTFLGEFDLEQLERLADAAEIQDWTPGQVIVRAGETAHEFFVLLSGRARAAIDGREVSELLPGDAFGEIALIHGVLRTATVTAAEATRTCRVPAEAVSALAAS